MKTVLVGVGQAGGKVTTALAEYDARNDHGAVLDAVAINTAEADLQPLPIDTHLIGRDRARGQGVGGDNELGAEIMREHSREVLSGLGNRIPTAAESILVVAGLGGGTGSGGAPALVHELQQVYEIPIYVLGILPGRDEGSLYHANAGRSLKTCIREADATILVSNDAWRASGESLEEGYDRINARIAQRVGLLLAAGERTENVAESVVDTSEVINTLKAGQLAAIGYSEVPASEDAAENVRTVLSSTRSAIHTGTSLPDASSAESGLLVVAGHPDRIPRKGVERARRWLEDETGSMQVRGGDVPMDTEKLATLTLLGGVERSPRIEELMDRARESTQETETVDHAEQFANDELDDLM